MLQQLDDAIALDVVVFDDEESLLVWRHIALDPVEGELEIFRCRRFHQVRERAVREAVLPFLLDRQHLTCRWIELQVVQHGPTKHVGQEHIERNRRGTVLLGQEQCRLAAVGDNAFEALVACEPEQDARVMRIVVHDQQHVVAFFDLLAIVGHDLFRLRNGENRTRRLLAKTAIERLCSSRKKHTRRACVAHRQEQRKRAALSWRADQLDFASEQSRQLAADGEAQTRSAVFAARAGVGLLERFENQPLFFRRDADARIGDFDRDGALHKPQNRMIR